MYQKLCGEDVANRQTYVFKGEPQILVEFSAGDVRFPINYNGFAAKLDFLIEQEEEKKNEKDIEESAEEEEDENDGTTSRRHQRKSESRQKLSFKVGT